MTFKPTMPLIAIALSLAAAGCSDDNNASDELVVDEMTEFVTGTETGAETEASTETATETTVEVPTAVTGPVEGLRFENFLEGSIIGDVEEVDCTLSNGELSRCYQFNVSGNPTDHETGPYCPNSITDTAEAGGKWFDNGVLLDLDGEFFATLPARYGSEWILYDEATGLVNKTETPAECLVAAQLNPPEEFWYHCIQCDIEDIDPVSIQYTIPIVPVAREAAGALDNAFPGVALNGVGLSFPADFDGVVATFNIAALDDCVGHVNNANAYHYHGAAGCWHEVAAPDNHAPLIGYAMDGYAIHGMTNLDGGEPTDLDNCRGHTDELRGYHYHAASPGENMFIGCFNGEIVPVERGGGPGGPGGRPGG